MSPAFATERAPSVAFINLPTVPLSDVAAALEGRPGRRQPMALPLGILYLSAAIKGGGTTDEVALVDYVAALDRADSPSADPEEFIKAVAGRDVPFEPDVVAFSLIFSASYDFFGQCVAVLRRLWPRAVFVVGGTHATNTVSHLLRLPEVDYVACGEAEETFPRFLAQLAGGNAIEVEGFHGKAALAGGEALLPCQPPADLDALPSPDWSLVDMERYTGASGRQREILRAHRHASILTSRGCYFRCTFCSSHTVRGRRVRHRSPEKVVEEIRDLNSRYGVTLVMPEDDLFTADRTKVSELLQAIREAGIPGLELQFPDALSVNTMDEGLIDELRAAGAEILVLAIESGSPYIQRHVIRKNCNLHKAARLVAHARSRGMIVRCYYILGFPGETLDQMRETIAFARSLGADWSVFMIATPLPGSEMYHQFVRAGCIEDGPESWARTVYDERWFETPEVSAAELNEVAYRANLECNFLGNANLVDGRYERALGVFGDIVGRYPFHAVGHYCIVRSLRGLGRSREAGDRERELLALVREDPRAREMVTRYADLVPDLAALAL